MNNTDSVMLTGIAADALCDIVCHVGRVNVDLPSMAWLLLVGKELPDNETRFPHGKWATLQESVRQLTKCAKHAAQE